MHGSDEVEREWYEIERERDEITAADDPCHDKIVGTSPLIQLPGSEHPKMVQDSTIPRIQIIF